MVVKLVTGVAMSKWYMLGRNRVCVYDLSDSCSSTSPAKSEKSHTQVQA